MIRLSIIIPAYNAEPYIYELLRCLDPQITKEVEVIVIDDGSRIPVKTDFKWCKVIRQDNQGCSTARNAGLDKAKGEYISFIDADDLVSEDFVSQILEKTKHQKYDVVEFSWRSLTQRNWCCDEKLNSDNDRLPNPSVCTRVFNRKFVGDTRFNVKKDSTEDEDFSRKIGYLDNERSKDIRVGIITDYLYFYRDEVPMSKTKRFAAGLMKTKKVIYYYDHVTADMLWLLDEIKKEDEVNEVWLMTNQCDIEGMSRWCRIIRPKQWWAHYVRGEKTNLLTEKRPPLQTGIIIYRERVNNVGGLNTFCEHFIDEFSVSYDITVVCRSIYEGTYKRWVNKVRIICDTIEGANGSRTPIGDSKGSGQHMSCDILILPSFLTNMPTNIAAKEVVRMCHACKTDSTWHLQTDCDRMLFASRTAMESFGIKDGEVLHNLCKAPREPALILVSATRFPAPDKGRIEPRMRTLCKLLNDKDIPFVWLNFSDGAMKDPPKNFYNMGRSDRMPEVIASATYLVALSDSECWSYACLEALMAGTAIICTPFPSTAEMGIKDKVNSHIIPFDMDFDVEVLKDIPRFTYDYDNESIANRWREILKETKREPDYHPDKMVLIEVLQDFTDVITDSLKARGSVYQVTELRAHQIMATNPDLIRIIGG